MITGYADIKGNEEEPRKLFFIGLSYAEAKAQMHEKGFIEGSMVAMGMPDHVFHVMFQSTEEEIYLMVEPYLGPDTKTEGFDMKKPITNPEGNTINGEDDSTKPLMRGGQGAQN